MFNALSAEGPGARGAQPQDLAQHNGIEHENHVLTDAQHGAARMDGQLDRLVGTGGPGGGRHGHDSPDDGRGPPENVPDS